MNCLVTLGVAGEVGFGIMGARRNAELMGLARQELARAEPERRLMDRKALSS